MKSWVIKCAVQRIIGLLPFSAQLNGLAQKFITRGVRLNAQGEFKIDGAMCHYIGLADQYANFDSSITPFNFLKFTNRQWNLLNNSIIPLNRLQASDYRAVLEQTNFCITKEENLLGSADDLRSVRLAPEFAQYPFEELRIMVLPQNLCGY